MKIKEKCMLFGVCIFSGIAIQAQTVVDYDGNLYDTVQIGTQVWLKQNLKVTHYNNGTLIPNISDSASWAGIQSGARCYYDNDSATNDSVYGVLYNWYAATNSQKICPVGWRVPTDVEWTAIESFLGGSMIAGGPMKEAGTDHWLSPNVGATNSSQFTGLPGGFRGMSNTFQSIHENGIWWTYTSSGGSSAWSRYLWYLFEGVDRNPTPKRLGLSLRCIKDMGAGLGEIHETGKIQLFPNPAHDKVTLVTTFEQNNTLYIYNTMGQVVWQGVLTQEKNEVDIHALPAGIYFLVTSGTMGSTTHKLIKE